MAQRDVSYLMLAAFDEEDAYSDFHDACAAKNIPCPTFEAWRKQRHAAEAEELNDGLVEPFETDPDIVF